MVKQINSCFYAREVEVVSNASDDFDVLCVVKL